MKTYGQYCAIAKALDVVGDRWTLLLIRELAIRGGSRFTELRKGLPGVAPNLLSERLKDLERAGVIRRESAPPPVATDLYSLTDHGAALEPVLRELVRWGLRTMTPDVGTDAYQGHWFAYAASSLLKDVPGGATSTSASERRADSGADAVQLLVDQEAFVIRPGRPTTLTPGRVDDPGLTLAGPPPLVLAVLAGRLSVPVARDRGLEVEGDPALLSPCVDAVETAHDS